MNARNERNPHKKETEDKQMAAILSINAAGQSGKKINKNIYGHFSEHLGRCIYGGVYVGENSDIPNVNGMRTDVVQALKKIGVPVLAGRAAALRMNTTGRTASARKKPASAW